MQNEVDIFYTPEGLEQNYRWDRYQNGKLLNIIFHGGTFGNFLKFFIDKFSKLTPDIKGDPFNNNGTSHTLRSKDYSGLIQKYHAHFINDNIEFNNLPICIIIPTSPKHFLYLKKANWFRAGDLKESPDQLWQKPLGEMSERLKDSVNDIIRLYQIDNKAYFSWLPKFIVRDWYKLEFLQDLVRTHNYRWFRTLKTNSFFDRQKVLHFDLESFFDLECFIENIKKLNNFFELNLDFNRSQEMNQVFNKFLDLDEHRKECNKIEDILDRRLEGDLSGLDVSSEAFIYAYYERQFPDIQMPLTNRFFRDTEEIKQFLEYFPNWYRRPNPNLD